MSQSLVRIQARRGEPDTKTRLLDGWEQALQSDEIHLTAPASIALAEYVWIGGKLDQAIFPGYRRSWPIVSNVSRRGWRASSPTGYT